MSVRPPSDAVVALRSLPRRFRGLVAGLGDDESPEALVQRPGADGSSALAHLVAATRGVAAAGRGLDAIQHGDAPIVDPVDLAPDGSTGSLDERLAELGWETDAAADAVERVDAGAWSRTGQVAGGDSVTALELVWQAVDAAVAHLKAAEQALDEARRAR
ncbi:MAG: hypothetical protein M3Z03_08795 [Actinomycetota bacterium]|nr:hypothetical protein [Actinomycetota bacterium]